MIGLSRSISPSKSILSDGIVTKGQAVHRFFSAQAAVQKRGTFTSAALLAPSSMTVTSPVSGLEPANVWGFFEQLTKIPRPSKHEEKCGSPLAQRKKSTCYGRLGHCLSDLNAAVPGFCST